MTCEVPVVEIAPPRGWTSLQLRDVWRYRELLYFLAWRDVKVRYKQTVLGAAWAILQPVCTMVVFAVFFGRLAKMPSDGLPYPIFTYAALVPWTFFANGMNQASNSLVAGQNLITQVYFPRLIMPLSAVASGIVDFILALLVLVGMMGYYGIGLSAKLLVIPLFTLLALAVSLAVGLWLSALNVHYRDVKYVIPFLTQLWLFSTPIAYPSSLLAEPWRSVYGLNPMVGVVEGFRWALLPGAALPGPMIVVSSVGCLALLFAGAYYFRRMENTFADVL